jgi:hypothetical protein
VEEAGLKDGSLICIGIDQNKSQIALSMNLLKKMNDTGITKCKLIEA